MFRAERLFLVEIPEKIISYQHYETGIKNQ